MNNAFPSRKMRDCKLAYSFWKPYKHTRKMAKVLSFENIPHFYWKNDRGLSLQMVFSPLFVETLFYVHPALMFGEKHPELCSYLLINVFIATVFAIYSFLNGLHRAPTNLIL